MLEKAAANLRKHGVSFDEAATVFLDPLSVAGDNPDHSADESRFVTFGISSSGRLLVVAHAQHEDAISNYHRPIRNAGREEAL